MKYIKGTQTYKLDADDVELTQISLVCDGIREGLWVEQHENEIVLQNHWLYLDVPTWGVVIPSARKKGDPSELREVVEATSLVEKQELTLHPEAWDKYLKEGSIDEDGNFQHENEDEDDGDGDAS